jgi:ubiquinone/menaquinone biosynthesis C-methylase UbiE
MDDRGGAAHRSELLGHVTGVVVEVGAGAGASFAHYGPAVKIVHAIEPSESLRSIARIAADRSEVEIVLSDGTGDSLPVDTASCDWAVCSLVLCSVPDQASTLAEIARVLKPGGQLAFYEHVRSHNPILGGLEDLLTPPWSAVAGGCHLNRATLESIAQAGFEIEDPRRFGFSPFPGSPRVAHVAGTARRRPV